MKKDNNDLSVYGSICHEVQIHYKRPVITELKKISSSDDCYAVFKKCMDMNRIDFKEFFWVMLLTNSNRVLAVSEVGVGTSIGVIVNIKELFQLALLMNASSMIVAHNHPSGKLQPSEPDRKITNKIQTVAKALDIQLLDHLIITTEDFLSFSDSGWM